MGEVDSEDITQLPGDAALEGTSTSFQTPSAAHHVLSALVASLKGSEDGQINGASIHLLPIVAGLFVFWMCGMCAYHRLLATDDERDDLQRFAHKWMRRQEPDPDDEKQPLQPHEEVRQRARARRSLDAESRTSWS